MHLLKDLNKTYCLYLLSTSIVKVLPCRQLIDLMGISNRHSKPTPVEFPVRLRSALPRLVKVN